MPAFSLGAVGLESKRALRFIHELLSAIKHPMTLDGMQSRQGGPVALCDFSLYVSEYFVCQRIQVLC